MNDPLCSFAVIADTHTRPEEGDLSSPWLVNELANDRCRYVTALPTYGAAAQAALAMFADLDAEIRYIPGNHDVGDKPFKAMPAAKVTDDGVALYQRYFGAPFSAFDFRDCRFVLINSPVLNSGLASEEDQRTWLLSMIERCGVEALFAGHVHSFFYHRHGNTDCYLLPATSFFRQDYAELFRIEAAPEHGRNDAEKLGFFMVDVHADGHIARCLRTNGETLKANVEWAPPPQRIATLHPRERRRWACTCATLGPKW